MNNLNKISFVIQARTGSTRLQNKMILPFFNQKTILELIIEKLLSRFDKNQIILATTINENDNILEQTAVKYGVSFFRGEENNVLKRFIDCANHFNVCHIVRVCADNPFLDIDLLCELIESVDLDKTDYCSYMINETPAIKTHFGFFAEYVALNALKKVNASTNDALYLEHVTNFIYSHPDSFCIYWRKVPILIEDNLGVRLTVDTIEDFETCKLIYKTLIAHQQLNYLNILNYINLHPFIKEQMVHQIQRHEK